MNYCHFADCLAIAGLALCLAGCAVGPDFTAPSPPTVAAYADTPLVETVAIPGIAGGVAQHVTDQETLSAKWWEQFQSDALNTLEKAALSHNPTLAAARASLRAAHQQALAGRGTHLPHIGVGMTATRTQDPPAALAPVPSTNGYLYNLITPELSIAYSPDVFGLALRRTESLAARARAAHFAAIAEYNTLTTQVLVVTIEAASLEAQLGSAEKLIHIDQRELKTARYRLKTGYASAVAVSAQRTQLAQARTRVASLHKQLSTARHRLAVLCGHIPGTLETRLPRLEDLNLPRQLPLSLPSQLVAQRPDIRQAQAAWHASSAAIGIAEAKRLPHIQLSANVGSTALAIADVFTTGTGFWTLAAGIAAPLFKGGALRHAAQAAKAEAAAAAARYRATVLHAFEDVADTLSSIDQDAKRLKAAAEADQAAGAMLEAVSHRFHGGYASGLDLAQAEQTREQARMSLIQARALRYIDTAALFHALGGGWWNRPPQEKP